MGAALTLGACEYRSSEARPDLQQEQQRATAPDQASRDVAFSIYENQSPRAVVEAALMERYEREDSTYTVLRTAAGSTEASRARAGPAEAGEAAGRDSAAGRVVARLYRSGSEDGGQEAEQGRGAARGDPEAASDSVSATIRANRIVYHDAAGRFDARGHVVVKTATGKRLEGEHLAWHEEEKRIATPGFVEITTPTDRIQGYDLRADENLDSYQLGRVTGRVTVEDAP
ncbi:MAG: hypothetical protein BRD48_05140 [Bacteroidetes bacterium QS_9_68_14]|nr:MAG: hypothetical protein BRD48_05140 [Bacteroidetes bacterium QS_9_68_14]